MRVSYEWLSSLIDLPQDVSELVDAFSRTGTEVEGVEKVGEQLDHVVTAQVIAKEPHPDSDHMWVCTVDVGNRNLNEAGEPEPLQIVCGAQNFNAGDKIVTAMIGAQLPGGITIKKSKLRGVQSFGMNCSERELGLGDSHAGIMILPPETPVGMDFSDYLGTTDTVIDCEITPNRPDCMSMLGLAYECAAIFNRAPHIDLPELIDKSQDTTTTALETAPSARKDTPAAHDLLDISIADPELSARYVARVFTNVKIAPSPDWLAKRIVAAGGRPINNVVDITNYVMFLTGHPLHAFDYDKLQKNADGKAHLEVRLANDGQQLTTLDGTLRKLTSQMIVIADTAAESSCDAAARVTAPSSSDAGSLRDAEIGNTSDQSHARIAALAGVMGGFDTEIDEHTTTIVLESATFSPPLTSRTSRTLDLMSEASMRYERGVDAKGCELASRVAAALFQELCGADVCAGSVDVYPEPKEPVCLVLRPARVHELLGVSIPTKFMVERLERLGCTVAVQSSQSQKNSQEQVQEANQDNTQANTQDNTQANTLDSDQANIQEQLLTVTPPSFRFDLTREIDLIEEVARLWGEQDIPATIPASKNHVGGLNAEQKLLRRAGARLRAMGLSETTTYCFADPTDLERFRIPSCGKGSPVILRDPLVADQSAMRQDLLPHLLRSVAYNLDHGVENISLYELGRVFYGHGSADKTAADKTRADKPEADKTRADKTKAGEATQPDEPSYICAVLCGYRGEDSWNHHAAPYDFFDAKGVVEDLLAFLHLPKIRFRQPDASEYPFLQPGSAAEVMSSGEVIGWVGALHPKTCKAADVAQPVFAFELSVKAILRKTADQPPFVDLPTYPGITHDIALVVDEAITYEQIMQRIHSAGGKLLSEVRLFDVYRDEERVGAGKKSMAFSLLYRSAQKTLTSEEVQSAHDKLVAKVMRSTGGEIRS